MTPARDTPTVAGIPVLAEIVTIDTAWKHKKCGGPVASELHASDSEKDYYVLVCPHCRMLVETRDLYYVGLPAPPELSEEGIITREARRAGHE